MPDPRRAEAQKDRPRAAFIAACVAFALGAGCSKDNASQGGPATGGASPGGAGSGNAGGQTAGQGGQGASMGPGGTSGGSPGGSSATSGGTAGSAGNVAPGGTSGAPGGTSGASGAAGVAGATGGTAGASGSAGHPNVDGGCCTQRECQPEDVKTCVCTTWQQDQCCTGEWNLVCQTTAEAKCQAEKCLPPPEPTGDAGTIDPTKGACCAVHTTPGCEERDVETCICKLLPDCCTNMWDSICVQLVREKHCEPGIRDCVCKTWQQQGCCDTAWTQICKDVAEDPNKCHSAPSCP